MKFSDVTPEMRERYTKAIHDKESEDYVFGPMIEETASRDGMARGLDRQKDAQIVAAWNAVVESLEEAND